MNQEKTITGREKEILQLIAKGKSSTEIGSDLGISLKTVETHRKNLHAKFSAANACHLIYMMAKRNII